MAKKKEFKAWTPPSVASSLHTMGNVHGWPPKRESLSRAGRTAAALLVVACAHAGVRDDAGWPPAQGPDARYGGMVQSSYYLTMRDGVKIAVTLYVPDGLAPGAKVPAILRQTRYWRDWVFHFPFSLFLTDNHNGPTRERFVRAGYAWIDSDVRGTGASTGRQQCSYCPDEVRDSAQLVDWIVAQSWSNGKVGATGISYDGTAAEMLLLNHHPAVKAIAPRFSMFDAYTDIAFPGGIHNVWFTEEWGKVNRAQDRMAFHEYRGFAARLAVGGPAPVDGQEDVLHEALESHKTNYDVHAEALGLMYRDDTSPNDVYQGRRQAELVTPPTDLKGTIGLFSPHSYRQALQSAGVPIFSYSGWWDGAYPRAAIKRFLTIQTSGSRLILGPWDHGGWQHIEPFAGSHPHAFDHDAELLRFFDRYVRDAAPAVEQPTVAYYTMGKGVWNFADTWPPPAKAVRLFAAEGNLLSFSSPERTDGMDRYTVDPTAGAGTTGRWNSQLNFEGNEMGDGPRNEADEKLLTYTSPPLDRDMEVTGHPLVSISAASTATDGFFFAYLEDVAPDGTVAMITEGQLRGVHRHLSSEPPPYTFPAPYRSYECRDAAPLVPGKPVELLVDLIPTSYLFRAGHSVRLALAGADRDHFAPAAAAEWTVYRSLSHATWIELPVVDR